MIDLTWEDIGEHIDKGDLKEWLKEERAKDKARQLSEDADTPQTETQNSNKNSNVISVYDGVSEAVRCAMCSNPNKSDRGCDGACSYDEKLYERIMKAIAESVADTPQTDLVKDSPSLVKGLVKYTPPTDGLKWEDYVPFDVKEPPNHVGVIRGETDCAWK